MRSHIGPPNDLDVKQIACMEQASGASDWGFEAAGRLISCQITRVELHQCAWAVAGDRSLALWSGLCEGGDLEEQALIALRSSGPGFEG